MREERAARENMREERAARENMREERAARENEKEEGGASTRCGGWERVRMKRERKERARDAVARGR
jgi:hypothetical protein